MKQGQNKNNSSNNKMKRAREKKTQNITKAWENYPNKHRRKHYNNHKHYTDTLTAKEREGKRTHGMPENGKRSSEWPEKRRKYTFTVKTEKKTECGTQNTETSQRGAKQV